MKDHLGEAPPTIGTARAMGVVAVLVRCNPPCRRQGSVRLDALRLPDDTPFGEIAIELRFVCENCGRRATKVEVDWEAGSTSALG